MAYFKFFFIFCFLVCGCQPRVTNLNSSGRTIVCFGDSLTRGVGADPGEDYPSQLSALLGFPVINAGVDGDTTFDALRRIESDVLEQVPYLVIVEFSANDFLEKIPQEQTFANLDEIVKRIQEQGSMVALVHVRAGFFNDEYIRGFRVLSRKYQTILIENVLGSILANPSLKSDYAHPNAQGYQVMAQTIYENLKPYLRN